MGLSPGNRVGPYEILAPLGAGGMGEVYRARDARLGRDVAIKVLPASFAGDKERLHRFEQEARAAGLLNHPNILAVYDVGSDEGTPFVVSELLEGETLGDRIADGPLAPRKATELAVQIARGLAAAHEKGIVHRDLKPENLFVTRDGRAKILDFGLAKLALPEGPLGDVSEELTRTRHTEPGRVMGTVGYMSPEQVRGQAADHRADIFSFGAVLYEIFSGRRAFRGASAVETMSAILSEEPPALAPEGRQAPVGLERIVRRCLEKRADDRFQSARDLAFALEALADPSGTTRAMREPVSTRGHRLRPRVAVAALALVVCAAAFSLGRATAPAASPAFKRLTFRRGSVHSARFAPDGQTILYNASWEEDSAQIFSTRPETVESRPLGIAEADLLAISRTGELALRLRNGNVLARVPLEGGTPRQLQQGVVEADWAGDGQLAVVRTSSNETWNIEYPPGKLFYAGGGRIESMRLAPDGRRVAFFETPRGATASATLVVAEAGGVRRVLQTGFVGRAIGLAWSPDGEELWFTATRSAESAALYATNLAGRQRLVYRAPVPLRLHDISRAGAVLITYQNSRSSAFVIGGDSGRERDLTWLDSAFAADLSADGRLLLTAEFGEGGGPNRAVYLRETSGAPAVRLGEGGATAISPDAKWVLTMRREPPPTTPVLLPTGPGEAIVLDRGPYQDFWGGAFLPDGKGLIVRGREADQAFQLVRYETTQAKPRALSPPGIKTQIALTPDGAAVTAQASDGALRSYPLDGGEPRRIPGALPGDAPVRWSLDGRWLLVARLTGSRASLHRIDTRSGRRDPWREIAAPDAAGAKLAGLLLATPDGRSFAYTLERTLSDLYLAHGLR